VESVRCSGGQQARPDNNYLVLMFHMRMQKESNDAPSNKCI
jgi:hypothetical protein